MKFGLTKKHILLNTLLVMMTSLSIGFVFYQMGTSILIADALDHLNNQIEREEIRLDYHIQSLSSDVKFLIGTPPVQGYFRALQSDGYDQEGDSSIEDWKRRLSIIFSTMLGVKPGYMQIRMIDSYGLELVRVDKFGNTIQSVPQNKLQNKIHSDYVKNTLKLASGQVYLSDITLNREHGKVTEPHTPMLRVATPIIDKNENKLGLIIINLDIGQELARIEESFQDHQHELYITNDMGDYLVHPDHQKRFGFELGLQSRIQDDYPKLTSLFSTDNTESRRTVIPKTKTEKAMVSVKFFFDKLHADRFITLILTTPYTDIIESVQQVLVEAARFVLLLILIFIAMGYWFSRLTTQPLKKITEAIALYSIDNTNLNLPLNKKDEIGLLANAFHSMSQRIIISQKKLQQSNENLEKMVSERTHSLEDSERRMRAIVKNMVDGLIIISAKGVVHSMNNAAELIFGYREDEVVGHKINMLIPESIASKYDMYLRSYFDTGEGEIIGGGGHEVEGLRKDGSIVPIELAVSETDVGGEKVFIGVLRDITERKQVDKMKNEFISTVSHELRTPLTSIRGALGLINGGVVGELPERAKEMFHIASNNTERLLLLINDILDSQKIEFGDLLFTFQNIPLMPVLEQAIKDNAAYGEQFGVEFVIIKRLEDAHLFVNRDRLMQVMANLLSNAAKFSPRGSKVEINIARYRDNSLRISVSDHGPGVSEAFQSCMFEKFTQADSSDTRQKGGTGLGLNISKLIVEKHGGNIGYVGGEGIGATFYFDLPEISSDLQHKTDETTLKPLTMRVPDILIVEDEPYIAALLKRVLTVAGHNCEIAHNIKEALQLLQEKSEQYKIITLDMNLQGEDGVIFFGRLRSDIKNKNIAVVIISVKSNKAKLDLNGGAINVVDWLQKPIDQSRLIDVLVFPDKLDSLPRVLQVGDDKDVHTVVNVLLQDRCELIWTTTLDASMKKLELEEFDLVLLDIDLPDGSGLDLLELIGNSSIPPRVVILSGNDVSKEFCNKVSTALLKSNANKEKLVGIIESSINQSFTNLM